MDGYITQERLLIPGPESFFTRSPFQDRMTLREIHLTAMGDYRKSVGKFGRPLTLFGKEQHNVREYQMKELDVVVEVLPTPDDIILKWEGDNLKPRWRVRVARDPNQRTRGLKDIMVAGPGYTLGKIGSTGPLMALSREKHTIIAT